MMLIMSKVCIKDLISQGNAIRSGVEYVPAPRNVIRTFSVYSLSNSGEYYRWKELCIRYLRLYYPAESERFIKCSNEFEENHQAPRYISNMIGILEACEDIPSDEVARLMDEERIEEEIAKVQRLEEEYLSQSKGDTINLSTPAFHEWHAEACVIFDKWFYPTDEDWVAFQNIDGSGNGYVLKHEYDRVYSSYRKLLARLKDGRNLKAMHRPAINPSPNKTGNGKIRVFVSYSHADKKWFERLQRHLKVLSKYSESVESWEDSQLKGGDKWKLEIAKAIEKANVAILLVSTDFLASDFISTDELPPLLRKAEEEGTRILPLIVAPCSYGLSELSDFQAINSPDKTLADIEANDAAVERVYLELVKTIQTLI